MSQPTYDPMFEAPGAKPPYDAAPEPKRHGCWFYGCIIAAILFVLVILIAVAAFFAAYRYVGNIAKEYTDTQPMPLPRVELPPDQHKELKARFDAFKAALDKGEAATLELNSDELNDLIQSEPKLQNKIAATIDGDKIGGQISWPLTDTGIPFLKGRYLNAKATFRVSLVNGILLVTLDSAEVRGKAVPEQAMASLRNENLAKNFANDPDGARKIQQLESIEVKDGKLIVKSRSNKAEATEDEKTEPPAADKTDQSKDEAAPKEEPKAVEKPETKSDEPADEKKDERPKAEKPADEEAPKAETKPEAKDGPQAARPQRGLPPVAHAAGWQAARAA